MSRRVSSSAALSCFFKEPEFLLYSVPKALAKTLVKNLIRNMIKCVSKNLGKKLGHSDHVLKTPPTVKEFSGLLVEVFLLRCGPWTPES